MRKCGDEWLEECMDYDLFFAFTRLLFTAPYSPSHRGAPSSWLPTDIGWPLHCPALGITQGYKKLKRKMIVSGNYGDDK